MRDAWMYELRLAPANLSGSSQWASMRRIFRKFLSPSRIIPGSHACLLQHFQRSNRFCRLGELVECGLVNRRLRLANASEHCRYVYFCADRFTNNPR